MCAAGFGFAPGIVRPAVLMLVRLVDLNARWQKTFLLNFYRLIDTQGRGVHGPDERGLERLFNITSNYITVRLASAATSRTSYRTVNPQMAPAVMCVMEAPDG